MKAALFRLLSMFLRFLSALFGEKAEKAGVEAKVEKSRVESGHLESSIREKQDEVDKHPSDVSGKDGGLDFGRWNSGR